MDKKAVNVTWKIPMAEMWVFREVIIFLIILRFSFVCFLAWDQDSHNSTGCVLGWPRISFPPQVGLSSGRASAHAFGMWEL